MSIFFKSSKRPHALFPHPLQSPGVLAAIDSTVHKNVGERYKISGFPTVKYFENGEDRYTLPHLRTKDKIVEWLHK